MNAYKIINVQDITFIIFIQTRYQSTVCKNICKMSLKWNEGLVMSFLKTYKQHPCLWNPYHMDYYNCREKNAALRKIIDALGIPGFTVNDYLQQIKIIREK